jgi:hypothetical protein
MRRYYHFGAVIDDPEHWLDVNVVSHTASFVVRLPRSWWPERWCYMWNQSSCSARVVGEGVDCPLAAGDWLVLRWDRDSGAWHPRLTPFAWQI